jgi:hypothetical protein
MVGKKSLCLFFAFTIILTAFSSCGKDNPTTPEVPETQSTTHPVIWINTFDLSFSASVNGANPDAQVFAVKNSGVKTLNYSISEDVEWLKVNPKSGSSDGNIIEHTVSINKSGLAAKEYTATLKITCDEACNSPQEVKVKLKVTKEPPPKIWISPSTMSFSAQEDGSNPSFQALLVKNTGSGTLKYQISSSADWLSVTPDAGSSAGAEKSHKVNVDISGMSNGNYNGKLTVSDSNAANSPQEVEVSLSISKTAPPQIWVSNETLSFRADEGGSNPSPLIMMVMNSGEGTLNYTINWNEKWLSANPPSGTSTGAKTRHTVSVNIGGLNEGTYSDVLTIEDPNASNSPQRVNVTLRIDQPCLDNKIYISGSPTSGQTGTIVSITTYIKCNTEEISAFGFKINYDPNMFSFEGVEAGNLTDAWSVDGQETASGVAKIGGYSGGADPLSTGSQGSIAVIKLKVTCSSCNDGDSSQISMDSFTDDIVGMIVSQGSITFTYKK